MSNDYSIACNSSRYTFGLVWACVGILVYPVGVLALYAYFLWADKDDIMVIKAAEAEARRATMEGKLRQELLRRELLTETQDTEETVALKKHLARLTDQRRRSASNVVLASTPAAVTRIVGAAELSFLFRAYKGKVILSLPCIIVMLFSPFLFFPPLPPHPKLYPCDEVLVLGVGGDRSQAAAHGRAVRGEHRVQRADRVRHRHSATVHEAVRILPTVRPE